MAKTPGKRHSGSNKEPVTIDLDSDDVKHIDETAKDADVTSDSDRAARDYGAGETADTTARAADAAPGEGSVGDAEGPGRPPEADTAGEAAQPDENAPEADLAAKDYGAGDESSRPAETVAGQGGMAAARPAPRTSVLSAVGGGIVGALVALAAAGGASYLGIVPTGGGTASAEIEQLKAGLSTVRDRLAAEEAASREEIPAGVSQALDEAHGGIDSLTKSIESLQRDVADLKQAVSTGATVAGNGAQPDGTVARLDALESRIEEIAGTAGAAKQAASDAAGRADQASGVAAKAAESANEAAKAANQAGSRLDALESEIAALAGKVSEGTGQGEVARAIAATALKSAIDRGSPFMGELETFASIAGDAPAIDALRAMAAGGVPTRGEISEEAGAAAYAMIEAAEAPPVDASLLDRLASSAKSLVKIRPTGDVEGENAAAIAARMESAVKRGDYAKALEEYDTLPEASKQAGAAFAARIRARMEADRLVDDVLSSALKVQE
ncbi:MAG: hypothetical protein K8H74_19265 [Notoacmeibacter sp.]|nr:hypothetical protein [Notoacmeibacter sp.]